MSYKTGGDDRYDDEAESKFDIDQRGESKNESKNDDKQESKDESTRILLLQR